MTEAGWTRDRPTEAGWYWWREGPEGKPIMARVVRGFKRLRVSVPLENSFVTDMVEDFGGEWLGPITPDSYQQGRVAGLWEAKENLERLENRDTRLQTDVEDFYVWIDDQLAQPAHDEKGVGDVLK